MRIRHGITGFTKDREGGCMLLAASKLLFMKQ